MSGIKAKIENGFEQSGHFIYRRALWVLLVIFLGVAALTWQIPKIVVNNSVEAGLHEDDPDRVDYRGFRDQFGRSDVVIIAAEGGMVFSADFFKRLRALTDDLEENVPFVEKVTSLVNIRNTRGESDQLIVEDLTEEWPETREDFAALKKRVAANPLYQNHVISEDKLTVAVVIETEAVVGGEAEPVDALAGFDESPGEPDNPARKDRYFTEAENALVVAAVKKIVDRHDHGRFQLAYSGGPVITDLFNQHVMYDTKLCVVLVILTNVLFLFLMFRRYSGVLFPILVILSSLLCTMGLLPLFGMEFKVTTTVIPAFLLAVGVADSVHILAIFYRQIDNGADREQAICHALGHSGLAIAMTSLTTAAGLFSFALAELTAIAEMGILAGIGVILALVFTVTMLPAFLAVFPIRARAKKQRSTRLMDGILMGFARRSSSHPIPIIIACLLLMAFFAFFLPRLTFSNNVITFFSEGLPEKRDLEKIDKSLKGVLTMEVVVDLKNPQALYDPENLKRIRDLEDRISRVEYPGIFVGKILSINDVIREINQALNENDPAHYRLPKTRQAVAQEILLFENSGSDDLESLVDSEFSMARITVKTPWADTVILERFVEEVRGLALDAFPGDVKVMVTGEMALMAKTLPAALRSMGRSYAIAFVVITFMMMFLVGDVKIGLLAMFPNLLPIVLVMGYMGLSNTVLNMNTIMIGAIALGLVVDDTMHFMYNYRRHYSRHQDPFQAIKYTLLGTGRALTITSVVLCGGFLVLLAGSMTTSNQFGVFTAIIIFLALMADFTLAPALMVVVHRLGKGKQAKGQGRCV